MSESFMFTVPTFYTEDQVFDYFHPSQKAFKCLPVHLRTLKMSEAAVAFDGGNLRYVPLDIQTSEMQMVAIKQYAGNIALMYPHFITAEIAKLAVKSDIRFIRFVPKSLQTPGILALLEGHEDPGNHNYAVLDPVDKEGWKYI